VTVRPHADPVDQPAAPFPCPCCGHLVFNEPPGSYEIRPICFWEDDLVQLRWPDFAGGANRPSLVEAQQSHRRLGAVEERCRPWVRDPSPEEPADPAWRPIDPERDSFEPISGAAAPWPDDRTVLYWWRPTFWRRS